MAYFLEQSLGSTYAYDKRANCARSATKANDDDDDDDRTMMIIMTGADPMGPMRAIAPTAKKLWGRCPQVAPQEFCYAILWKQYSESIFACTCIGVGFKFQPFCNQA